MKLYKSDFPVTSPLTHIYIPFSAVVISLHFLMPHWVAQSYLAHWPVILICLSLFAFPIAKTVIPSGDSNVYSPMRWLTGIFMLQIAAVVLFQSTFNVLLYHLTVDGVGAKIDLLHIFLRQGGLFPWGLITLATVCFVSFSYIKGHKGLMSSVMSPIFKCDENTSIGVISDSYLRGGVFCALLVLLFCFATMLLSIVADSRILPMHLGASMTNLLLTAAVMRLLVSKKWKELTSILMKIFPLYIVALCMPIVTVLIFCTLSMASIYLGPHMGVLTQKFALIQHHHVDYWLIGATLWWALFIPMIAATIAKISRGYQVWHLMLASLALPITYLLINLNTGYTLSLTSPWLGMAACAFFILLWINDDVIDYCIRAALPSDAPIKHRNHLNYSAMLLISVAALVMMYWVMGVTGIGLVFMILAMPVYMLLLFSSFSVFSVAR